jgi:hypothetical protein
MAYREKREFVGFERLQLVSTTVPFKGKLCEPLGTLSVRLGGV